jgi:MinD-like ATPase involved in chromosome partitioning or flagellar assembly
VTDSHNSGQHKDREAAAAEVRRMWQPTPSWVQPDPNPVPARDPEPVDDADDQESPAEAWSRQANRQATPWAQPQSQTGPSWAQPAAESTGSWTQPETESDDADTSTTGETEAGGAAGADEPGADGHATDGQPDSARTTSSGPATDGSAAGGPVFGGSSFTGSGHGTTPATGGPQSGPQLSPAAQHFFPQGIPGQQAPQQREVSYRTDELIQALPLPREAPAERGIRSALRLRPGSAERLERIARATAATAFRRPVTIVVANPKGGSGKTPTTLLLAGALGQARGGGVVAWDNNELRGNMHLRTHDTNSRSTVTDMLQAMPMLTQPDARLGDVAAYLRHQVAGQYDVLTSATTTYAQIEARDFDQIHRLLSRFYKVLVIDTGNNEGSSNWREAMKAADALVIPIKWKSLSCAAAVQMLEELDNQGPEAQRLIRRAVIAVSNGPGDVNKDVEKQLRPYFDSRAAAVVDIPTDAHIAAEGPLDHAALQPATRRAALELAAKVSEQISVALNTPR